MFQFLCYQFFRLLSSDPHSDDVTIFSIPLSRISLSPVNKKNFKILYCSCLLPNASKKSEDLFISCYYTKSRTLEPEGNQNNRHHPVQVVNDNDRKTRQPNLRLFFIPFFFSK